MYVSLATLDRAVRMVDELSDLHHPDDVARAALPALAEVIGRDACMIAADLSETDRAVLAVLHRPLLHAFQRARLRSGLPVHTADGVSLTATERAVLALVAEGLTNQAIGRRLTVSPRTVAKHLENIYRKLGVTNRAAAVAREAAQLPASLSGFVRPVA